VLQFLEWLTQERIIALSMGCAVTPFLSQP